MTADAQEIESQEHFERIRIAIESGSAICLLGAGFSLGATDGNGNPIPSTSELTEEIKVALSIPVDEKISLSEVADFANEVPESRSKLITLLINRLTSCASTENQSFFSKLGWRSVFTTNFDDIVERCGGLENRIAVTPQTNAGSISPDKVPLYYMHGRALDLRERDTDPHIVISETNYLKLDQQNRDLYAKFFNEIACAKIIIIVGCSLRDLEIASGFLNGGADVRAKTFIVTNSGDSDFALSRLRKFGHVLPIGLDGFIEKYRVTALPEGHGSKNFQYLDELELGQISGEVEDKDFLSLILRGELEPEKYLRQKSSPNEPYCIDRSSAVGAVLNSSVNRFIVSSDFGNGKSGFLRQLAAELIANGSRVFSVETRLLEVYDDITNVLRLNQPVAFLVDDVLRYRDVAVFIGARLHSQAVLVCTTRGDSDSRFEQIVGQLGGAHRHIDLNTLNDDEIMQWDRILERWGLWEQRVAVDQEKRIEFLKVNCSSENRSIILSIFRNSKVGQTIDQIVEFFLKSTEDHRKAFAGLLVSSLCQQHVSWDSIVNWLDLDEDRLRKEISASEVAFLFSRGRNWNLFTSSQLADYILRNKFVEGDRDLLVSVYSEIVLRTAMSANDDRLGWDFRENSKELMKYRFLTRLFGDSESAVKLIGRVYKRLSSNPRIRNNPQFWLQYAMSRMEVDDLDAAETYINTALGKAEERGKSYSPFQILDQRARLYLRKNSIAGRSHSRNELRVAVGDLMSLSQNDDYDFVYTMRSLPLIVSVLELHIDDLEDDLRRRVLALVNLLLDKSGRFDNFPRAQKGETKVLKKALQDARLILLNA